VRDSYKPKHMEACRFRYILKLYTKGASGRQLSLRIKKITGFSLARGQALDKTHHLILTSLQYSGGTNPSDCTKSSWVL